MNLDSDIMLQIFDLADMINNSDEMKEYLTYKKEIEKDDEIKELRKALRREKELFEEVQRFGQFHPNYHEVKEKIDKILLQINENDRIKGYGNSEDQLNQLLYSVSSTLAHSISKSILVPGNDNVLQGSGCSTGSCNTCGVKGTCAI